MFHSLLLFLFATSVFAAEPGGPFRQARVSPECFDAAVHEKLQEDRAELRRQSWVDSKFSLPYLDGLQVIPLRTVTPETVPVPMRGLLEAAARFPHTPLTADVALYRDAQKRPTLLFLFQSSKRKLAAFLTISFEKHGTRWEAFTEFLKADPREPETKGIGGSFVAFGGTFFPSLGVSCERFEAAWKGRPIWAMQGYAFDPDARFEENGVSIPQTTLVRNNFARFLARHALKPGDLVLDSGDLVKDDLSNVVTPRDYARVRHRRDAKVSVRPYIDADTFGPEVEMPPGMAFSLEDHRGRDGQAVSVTQNGKPKSDIAMPTWIAIRRFDD